MTKPCSELLKFAEMMSLKHEVSIYGHTSSSRGYYSDVINQSNQGLWESFIFEKNWDQIHLLPHKCHDNFLFLDFDHERIDFLKVFDPTCIVKTRRGYHLYYRLIESTVPVNSLYLLSFELSKHLGADLMYLRQLQNLNCCIRLPGSFDRRDNQSPFQTIVIGGSRRAFSLSDIEEIVKSLS